MVVAQLSTGTAAPWSRHCTTLAAAALGQYGPAGRLRSFPDFIQVGPGASEGDAGLQPADNPDLPLRDAKPLTGLVESQRHQDLRVRIPGETEARRHHSDNRVRRGVEIDRLAQHVSVGAKILLPEGVH